MKKAAILLFTLLLMSCASQRRVADADYVLYGVVKISGNLTESGKFVYEDDSIVEISVNGVVRTYNKSEILGFEKMRMPDNEAIYKDISKNESKPTNKTRRFVIFAVMIIAITAVVVLISQ